jgi:poly-gamma-glutamate synthesis protein (capsule biosynthesis protein)
MVVNGTRLATRWGGNKPETEQKQRLLLISGGNPMIVGMVGDVMLGRGVAQEIPRRAPESFWGNTLPLLQSTDLLIAGLECAITTSTTPWTRTPKVFHFRAPPQAIEVLHAAGVRLVSLANNHTLDFEVQGLLDTLDYLDAAGIARTGAGRNLAEARWPAIVAAAGMRVGMVAFTDNEPGWAATEDQPGTNYIPIIPDAPTLQLVAESVQAARADGKARFPYLLVCHACITHCTRTSRNGCAPRGQLPRPCFPPVSS